MRIDLSSSFARVPLKVAQKLWAARLPDRGSFPFRPKLARNSRGETIVDKATVRFGPKSSKVGYLDTAGNIWIRDTELSGYVAHWDVQINEGREYINVDYLGRYRRPRTR